jgi:hypothetical protein
MIEFKVCKLCKEELSINNFWKNPSNKDGYFGKCKVCATKTKDINTLKKQKYLEDNLWTCSTCSITLPLTKENFHKRNDSDTGFQHRCKKCLNAVSSRTTRKINHSDLDLFLKDIFHLATYRSKKLNRENDISIKFLKELWETQKGLCALTNLPMQHSISKGKLFNNLSIDRIDSSLGYTKNNIQLVCSVVNRMKSDLSSKEFYNICKLITNNYEK